MLNNVLKTATKHRTTRISIICFLVLIFVVSSSIYAEVDLRVPPEGYTQVLKLTDGSTLIGRILQVDGNTIQFETNSGSLTIAITKIKEMREVTESAFKGGKYWFENPNQTRLYVSPTGRSLKKGQGYFSDILIFFPSIAIGVTDNISLGGGVSIIPGLDLDEQLIYGFTKIGFTAKETFSVAGSMLMVRIPKNGVNNSKIAGILFGTGTIGSGDASMTFGLGYGYVGDEIADKPAVLLGGEYRFARTISLVTENWVFPGVDDPLISYGLRFFGESISVDLAFFNVGGEDAFFPGIPIIEFSYNF